MDHSRSTWPVLWLLLFFSTLISAYRPVQFVKHTGENGRADQAFSLINYYNSTTQQSDLYVRMEAFRYQSSAKGWASLALGRQMQGALMFLIYGDPSAPGAAPTLSVRTADGHHPPRPLDEMTGFYSGVVPEVDVVSTRFEEYTGGYYQEKLQMSPSHLAVAEFIIRGYDRWTAAPVSNSSDQQAMIWSSNFKQDFQGDYSYERAIDMHQFGLGFGFLWVDLKNAESSEPAFGPITDLEGHKGLSEVGPPPPPTEEELAVGAAFLASVGGTGNGGTGDDTTADTVVDTGAAESTEPSAANGTPGPDGGSQVEEPVTTPKQWNIRSFMWHLHGFLMVIPFLILYPLGTYLIRSPRPTAFNLHWTIQSLASMSVAISSIIAFINSRSISIAHQYFGILIICALTVQTVLGWRHHVAHLQVKRKTWMSNVHVWLGRAVLPAGMANLVSGLLLRHYGRLTVGLAIGLIAVEIIGLAILLAKARNRTRGPPGSQRTAAGGPPTGDEAEEYFQLAGDDDDDSFSGDDDDDNGREGEAAKRATKLEEKREQQKKLAQLDKV